MPTGSSSCTSVYVDLETGELVSGSNPTCLANPEDIATINLDDLNPQKYIDKYLKEAKGRIFFGTPEKHIAWRNTVTQRLVGLKEDSYKRQEISDRELSQATIMCWD